MPAAPGPRRGTRISTLGAVDGGEAELLARARSGNLPAFEEIVRRYQRRVYATALRIVRRHELADEVAQEAFLRAFETLGRFDLGRPFGPWICRIAANLAITHVRSPAAREQPLPDPAPEPPSAAPGPLDRLLDGEARTLLDRALGELPAEQRAVFALRVFEDLSYREIAEALGIQMGTVMSRLARARERLREALTPYLGSALRRAGGDGS
ncbi:MAG TPA: sigma-70 family RNA polymerase sigma factor [Vicinamibacteria bacterium]|nr:sigma-70 family RNA polymerase sigma factor [Vicinamibacteria bacterium]